MLSILLLVLSLLIVGLCYYRFKGAYTAYREGPMTFTDYSNRQGFFILSIVVSCIVLALLLTVTGQSYFDQVDSIESIERDKKVVVIYKKKADVLTKQFVKYLMNYSEFEKDIYTKISPKDVDIYMVKYPELKASTTVIALVDSIYKLQDDVYDTEIAIEQYKKDIRTRLRNPFAVTSLLPSE